MLYYQLKMKSDKVHFVNGEEVQKKRMNLSYTKRFELLMKLIRINKMMKNNNNLIQSLLHINPNHDFTFMAFI